ncbi:hypothetical protein [Saccharopolyspora sp. NPDC002686]|uniref:hypothetical protein n=1 Tax=Saccharopolyspora sp. NPDC002686 TaxID=3154541 RepID=UPI00331F44A7
MVQGWSANFAAFTSRFAGRFPRDPHHHGTLLFDLATDPEQRQPIVDDEIELRMAKLLVGLLRDTEAPASQYERLGLPVDGPVENQHLLVRAQQNQAEATAVALPPGSTSSRPAGCRCARRCRS